MKTVEPFKVVLIQTTSFYPPQTGMLSSRGYLFYKNKKEGWCRWKVHSTLSAGGSQVSSATEESLEAWIDFEIDFLAETYDKQTWSIQFKFRLLVVQQKWR